MLSCSCFPVAGYSVIGWNHPGFGESTVSCLGVQACFLCTCARYWHGGREEVLLGYVHVYRCPAISLCSSPPCLDVVCVLVHFHAHWSIISLFMVSRVFHSHPKRPVPLMWLSGMLQQSLGLHWMTSSCMDGPLVSVSH